MQDVEETTQLRNRSGGNNFLMQTGENDPESGRCIELDVGNTLGDYSKINYSQLQESKDEVAELAPITDEEKQKMVEER
jgi:hypothetical protein